MRKMRVLNLTKCTTITSKTEVAGSFFGRMKGLMFREYLEEGTGMLFMFKKEGKHSMWMMGMRFPIDLIFIGRERRVADVRENFMPLSIRPSTWGIARPERKCKYVLEVNAGTVRESGTRPGDELRFVF